MGRLKNIGPALGGLPPRLGYLPGDKKAAERSRSTMSNWRGWYKLARWGKLRRDVFVRDNYRCQRTGELCIGKHPAPNSPVANHKVPHRGDPRLFWDINNIETVAKHVHDGEIQREEQAVPLGNWG